MARHENMHASTTRRPCVRETSMAEFYTSFLPFVCAHDRATGNCNILKLFVLLHSPCTTSGRLSFTSLNKHHHQYQLIIKEESSQNFFAGVLSISVFSPSCILLEARRVPANSCSQIERRRAGRGKEGQGMEESHAKKRGD